jgi:hypothetical protein
MLIDAAAAHGNATVAALVAVGSQALIDRPATGQ